jgi:hypothetical protein
MVTEETNDIYIYIYIYIYPITAAVSAGRLGMTEYYSSFYKNTEGLQVIEWHHYCSHRIKIENNFNIIPC